MKKWECVVCGLIYDEAKGWPDDGIAAGTRWEDVPDDWLCPDCGVGKEDFEMVELIDQSASISGIASGHTLNDPIVVLGSGLAGYGLVKQFRKYDAKTPLIIISSDDGRSYSKPMLSTGFTKKVSADDLTQLDAGSMGHELDASVWTNTTVESIDTENHLVKLSTSGLALKYGKLVLAIGADVHQPAIVGDAGSFVYSVNDLRDYDRFRSAIDSNNAKRICVIGGGLIGCEFTNDLLNGGFNVETVDPLNHCLPTLLPPRVGKAVQRALEGIGAKFHFGALVTEVNKGKEGVVVSLNNGETIKADLVLSAVGVRPRIKLAKDAGLNVDRGIVTDEFLRTSANDVYALGDCAEVAGHVLVYVAPLMTSAKALAKTLSGVETAVSYPAMPVTIKTPICPVVVSPAPKGVDGNWEVSEDGNSVTAEYRDQNNNLLGFALTGDAVKQKANLQDQLPNII